MTTRGTRTLTGLAAGLLALAATAAPSANPELVTRVPGNDGADGPSYGGSVTPNGRFVAFYSGATNLVDDDTNDSLDVFVRDLKSGTTERVSLTSEGLQVDADSGSPAISKNGKIVLFESDSGNYDTNDDNGDTDVFVLDRKTGAVRVVSGDADGNTGGDASSLSGRPLSDNGKYAVFSTAATLVAGDENGAEDVFFADLPKGTLTLISRNALGNPANGASNNPSLSPNGRFIAYQSAATDLPDATNSLWNVFVFDRKTGTTRLVSVDAAGGPTDGFSYQPSVSNNGQVVAFWSTATDLVAGDSNGSPDAFVRDLKAGTTRRISESLPGGSGGNGSATAVSLSANGKTVVFQSDADLIVPEDANDHGDVFVLDLVTGDLRVLTATAQGEVGDEDSTLRGVAFASNGKWLVFDSQASNLSNQDKNGATSDVFLVPAK